jgi:hypothetical protein
MHALTADAPLSAEVRLVYEPAPMRSLVRPFALLSTLCLAACGASDLSSDANAAAELSATGVSRSELTAPEATVSFNGDWSITQSAPLVAGGTVRFAYDASRLPGCRGEANGKPAWGITGAAQLNGGAVASFEAGGLSPSNGTNPPVVALPQAGDLAVWFQITNRWGCQAWDSNYGANYHLQVVPQPRIKFGADWSTKVEGKPGSTGTVVVDYALERLPACRQTYNGLGTWEILVFYRFDGGAVAYTPVTVPSGSGRAPAPAELKVPAGAGELELWFKNTDRAGCLAWDSAYGQNYHFSLR